eukprot:jgi/Ulvmu1/165/UM001_0169.1
MGLRSLELVGQAETYALCSYAMTAPQPWARLLEGLQHLRLTNSSDCTAAAAVCISLASALTSLHITGSPCAVALSTVPFTIPYINPEASVPSPAPPQPLQEHGIIPVSVAALQLVSAAALAAKTRMPCHTLHQPPGSQPPPTTGSTPPVPAAVPVKDQAVILPALRSLTTDASHLTMHGSILVLDQHPPSDLLTTLPDTIDHPQPEPQASTPSATVCLTTVATAAAARALTLPMTPPSAPARLLAHPHLSHITAPKATLLTHTAALEPLVSLSLRQINIGNAATHQAAPLATPHLQSLTFPPPSSPLNGISRTLPPPGTSLTLTQLHLVPPQRTTLPFSALARLMLDCPALIDLDVSRCITAPPAAIIAPSATTPVHFFLHIQPDHDADALDSGCRGPPARLRRFACDEAPGCLYLLLLLDGVRPVRALEHVSASHVLCLPGRLLALLSRQPRLQSLQLLQTSRAVSPPQDTAVLALLASTAALTSLTLSPSTPSCAQACAIALTAVLPCLRGLRQLSLPDVAASRGAARLLSALSVLTGLSSLTLSHADLDDDDVEVLVQACPRLTHLSIAHSRGVTTAAVHALLRLTALESLDVSSCTGLHDACGRALARMTTLTALSLACTSCGAAAARDLAVLPRLRHVALCPHMETHTGRGKGGRGLINRGCRAMQQRDDMVLELVQCTRLRGVTGSPCLLAKARTRLTHEGLAAPLWMM